MLSCFVGLCLALVATADAPALEGSPVLRILFAGEKWYKDAAGDERPLEGRLDINSGDGTLGLPPRFCSFRLVGPEEGKIVSRPIFTNGKDHLLGAYVGQKVKFMAKVVESEVDGKKVVEIWPAQIAVLGDARDAVGELKVLARTANWIIAVRRTQPEPYVIRDGETLARLRGIGGGAGVDVAAETTRSLARQFGVTDIDWKKQMVVVVSGGMRGTGGQVQIMRLALHEQGLDVHWKATTTGAVGASTAYYPTETVLVPRFDGEVRFFQEGVKQPRVVPAFTPPASTPGTPVPAPSK